MGPSILSHAEAKAHQVINPLPSGGGLWTKQPSVTIRPFHAALDALGIRRRRRYDARHTYATMCLMAGMHPAFIAKQLGHSLQILLSRYARWLDGEGDWNEMEKLKMGPKRDQA